MRTSTKKRTCRYCKGRGRVGKKGVSFDNFLKYEVAFLPCQKCYGKGVM